MSESKIDVCIVGGGIVGQMTALELALSGKTVHLIDKVYIGSSRHNIGESSEQGVGAETLPFIRHSNEIWQNTAEQYGANLGFEVCGSATFATTEEESAELKARVEEDKAGGLVTQFIKDNGALSALLGVNEMPETVDSARYAPKDAAIDTGRALDNLRVLLIRHGVKLWSSDEVEEILFDGDRVIGIRAAHEKIYADYTVLSAGVWTTRLINQIGLHAPVRPARAHLIEVSPFRKFPNQVLSYNTPTGDIIMKRMRTGRVLITYTGVTDQAQATYSTQPDYDAVRSVLHQCTQLIEGLRYAPVQKLTVISLAVTPDNKPYVGPVAKHPGLILAIGFNGKSYAFAAGVGKFIRSVVNEEEFPVDMSALSPDRVHKASEEIQREHMESMSEDQAAEAPESEDAPEKEQSDDTMEKAQEMLEGNREGGDWESNVEKGDHDATMADEADVLEADKQGTDWEGNVEKAEHDVTMEGSSDILEAGKEGGDWEDNVEQGDHDAKMADAPEVISGNKEGGDWEDNVEQADNDVAMADASEVISGNKEGGDWDRPDDMNNPDADMSYSEQEEQILEGVDTAAEKSLNDKPLEGVDTAAEKSLNDKPLEGVDTTAEKSIEDKPLESVDTAAENPIESKPLEGVDTAAENPMEAQEFEAVDTAAEKPLDEGKPLEAVDTAAEKPLNDKPLEGVDTAAESGGAEAASARRNKDLDDEEAHKESAEKIASMGSSWGGREQLTAEQEQQKRENAQQKLREAQERSKLEEEKRKQEAQDRFAKSQEKAKLEQKRREEEEEVKRALARAKLEEKQKAQAEEK